MPELPEVERASRLVKQYSVGRKIDRVETNEDTIVFSGISHTDFANEITGRRVTDVARYGKLFYVELDGEGRMPVLHFGMTGNVLVKGEVPIFYKEGPRKGTAEWPPRFMKFVLHLSPTGDEPAVEIAFVDARRLGRIRLCQDPMKEPPISSLGFDPILSMPTIEDFSASVLKRSCPIKALLLDQSFSAGVGNWIADEVLYHARIHPEHRCNTLSEGQLASLHKNIKYVCETAVDVNADASKFPKNWLFRYRWGKGKKEKGTKVLQLPTGGPATIKWLTVGGRTSAFVVELQSLKSQVTGSKDTTADAKGSTAGSESESDLTALSDENPEEDVPRTTRKRKVQAKPKEPRQAPSRTSKRRKSASSTKR